LGEPVFQSAWPNGPDGCRSRCRRTHGSYYGFPAEHRRQIWSTISLERLNKEVSRRCDVVGIFPAGSPCSG
jgi:transposase-like protein